MRRRNAGKVRRGVVAMLGLFMLVAVVGMAAFAVDIGYAICVESQLQNAADAAALAAAARLPNWYARYYVPTLSTATRLQILQNATANLRSVAGQYAGYNAAGNVSALQVLDADVVPGYLDGAGTFTPTPADGSGAFPNSVEVTIRRDGQANGALPLFFASIFGTSGVNLSATARGTISDIVDLGSTPPTTGKLLPVALDVRIWQQFLRDGTSPSANNQVLSGPGGNPQLQVYPDASGFGSFGLVSIGPPASDVPTYRNWIDNGPSQSDLTYMQSHQYLPLPLDPAYWPAGPGMKSTLSDNFANAMGQPRLIPLYDGSMDPTGNGYPIVAFAGITITEATGSGSNMIVAVQPTAVINPYGQAGGPSGSSGTNTFSFSAPRLTR